MCQKMNFATREMSHLTNSQGDVHDSYYWEEEGYPIICDAGGDWADLDLFCYQQSRYKYCYMQYDDVDEGAEHERDYFYYISCGCRDGYQTSSQGCERELLLTFNVQSIMYIHLDFRVPSHHDQQLESSQ